MCKTVSQILGKLLTTCCFHCSAEIFSSQPQTMLLAQTLKSANFYKIFFVHAPSPKGEFKVYFR
jgi:hypothetical protein